MAIMTPESVLTIVLTVTIGLFLLSLGVSVLGVLHVRLKTERMLTDSLIVREAVKEAASDHAAQFETRIKAVESGWDEFHADMRKKLGKIYQGQRRERVKAGEKRPDDEEFEIGAPFEAPSGAGVMRDPAKERHDRLYKRGRA